MAQAQKLKFTQGGKKKFEYTVQSKEEAFLLFSGGRNHKEISAELSVPESTISRWRKRFDWDARLDKIKKKTALQSDAVISYKETGILGLYDDIVLGAALMAQDYIRSHRHQDIDGENWSRPENINEFRVMIETIRNLMEMHGIDLSSMRSGQGELLRGKAHMILNGEGDELEALKKVRELYVREVVEVHLKEKKMTITHDYSRPNQPVNKVVDVESTPIGQSIIVRGGGDS